MRWFHEGVDRLHVALARLLLPPVFRHGTASPPLAEHLAAVAYELPPLTAAGRHTLVVQSLVGPLSAGFRVRLAAQRSAPVVVYHHGIAEMPYDKSFRGIFRPRHPIAAHLVAVRAPFHRSWRELIPGLATLGNFLAMCAVALRLGEAVRAALVAAGARGSLVAGTSLGGFLTLLHHLFWGTADAYVPLLAGPDLAHVLLATHYRRLLAPHARADHIRSRLDFRQAFLASNPQRVFPLLARYDCDMDYAYQAACYAAAGVPVTTIDRGHLTGALAFAALRSHLQRCLQRLWAAA
ncbi:MAG: hypothetical protein KatS3mg131_0462 [Candidatus Tectimicrobiota bacterium]|nr:MAG: hypothetical protein KatS3mg131_0462 [Candidatus Tectomicrobia bacterium]